LDFGHVLNWSSGSYEVWEAAPAPPPRPNQSGEFDIKDDHQLVNLGGKRLLRVDRSGDYRVFDYDLTPGSPLLVLPHRAEGSFSKFDDSHKLIGLGDGRILDWVPKNGELRVWNYARTSTGGLRLTRGPSSDTWNERNIVSGHELVKVDTGHIIDWIPETGYYRIFLDNGESKGDILSPMPLAEGFWRTVPWVNFKTRLDRRLVAIAGGRVLDCDRSGMFWIFKFEPTDALAGTRSASAARE
jgi:hypothetical protein